MKKILFLVLVSILLAESAEARPHFGYHRPSLPRYEHRYNPAPVWGFAAGLVGGLLVGGYYYQHQTEPQKIYVPAYIQPEKKVCTSTVVNGTVVQNCVIQPNF